MSAPQQLKAGSKGNDSDLGYYMGEKIKQPWEQDIGDMDITSDSEFTCYISFFIESSSKFYGLMEMFNEAAENGKRWEIKVISKEYIKKTVLDYCTKTRERKPFNLLCDQIIRYAGHDFEGRIPPSLIGYFIKYEIRRLKNAYEDYIEYQKKYEEARLARLKAATKLDTSTKNEEDSNEIRGKSKTPTSKSKEGIPRTPNKSKLPKLAIPYGKRRPESELIIRSEEKKDIRYTKDFPTEGPQVYLVITTIYEQVASELIEVMKMPVVCIVKVGEENKSQKETMEIDFDELIILVERKHQGCKLKIQEGMSHNFTSAQTAEEEMLTQSPDPKNYIDLENDVLLEINKYYYELRANKKRNFDWEKAHSKKTSEVQRFWTGFNKKVRQPNNTNYEKTILLKYVPSMKAVDYTKDDWKEQLKNILYDEITYSLFNQCQIAELYKKYTSSTGGHILKPEKLEKPMEFAVYNSNLENILDECITVPIIYDSIVNQVVEYLQKHEFPDYNPQKETSKSFTQEQDKILRNKLNKLNIFYDLDKQKEECDRQTNIKSKTIFFGDKIKLSSVHIRKYSRSLREKTISPLKVMFSAQFKEIKVPKKLREMYQKHILLFQSILGIRQRKKLAEILILLIYIENILQSNLNTACPQGSKYLLENELKLFESKSGRNDKFKTLLNTMEEMDRDVLLQTVFDLTLTHNTYEVIYIPLLDSFLYKFYNASKNNFRTSVMQTSINLRDFLKYSLPNEKQWAQKVLNDLYSASIPKSYKTKLQNLEEEIPVPMESIEITPKLFIDNNSFLLYKEAEDDDIENKTVLKYLREINYEDTFLSHSPRLEKKTSQAHSNIDKSMRFRSLDNFPKSNYTNNEMQRSSAEEDYSKFYKEKKKNGQIYDLGPSPRLQFNNRSIEAIFRHGTKIRIQIKHKLYGSRKINLELDICNHRLYYSSSTHINKEQSTFFFIHRSGLTMSFKELIRETFERKKEEGKIGKDIEMEDCQINPSPKDKQPLKSLYLLTITWPTSCRLETKYLDEHNIYIKQFYLRKCPISEFMDKEVYRIFLENTVIKLLRNNSIEILHATGKKIICDDYDWEEDILTSTKWNLKMNSYMVIHSSGKVYKVNKNGFEIYEGNLSIQETLDFSLDHRLLEMQDGTVFFYKNDGTQIVEFPDKTRFIVEVRTNSGEEFKEPNEPQDYRSQEYGGTKIQSFSEEELYTSEDSIHYDDYIFISMYITVEHPNFATIGFCPYSKTTTIQLPKDIKIEMYSDKTYNILLGQGSTLSIKEDRVVFDKFRKGSLFQHSVIMPNVLKYNIIPDPPLIHFLTSDIFGNEIKINTQAEIYYKYALSEENSFCLKNFVNDTRFILIRRNLSGMEIFPQQKLISVKKVVKNIKGSHIQDYWNVPFKDTFMFYPAKSKLHDWTMSSTKYSNEVLQLPSTYGMKSWTHPFLFKVDSDVKHVNIVLLRQIRTLVISDIYNIFMQTLKTYKKMIDDKIKLKNCKCKQIRSWGIINRKCIKNKCQELYKIGTVSIKYPDTEFMSFLKNSVLLHALRVAMTEKSRPDEVNKFKVKRRSIFKKEIPPYFQSPFGMAYFVSKEIQDKINQMIEKKEYSSALRTLLEKEMKTVLESDIHDIAKLLTILKPEVFQDVPIQNILKAGRELEESFKNMGEVVKYHLSGRDCKLTHL